jgi:XTP/dITP diphosphohydrolase
MKPSRQRIYLATGNAHKVQEFQHLAETSGLAIEFSRPSTMPPVFEDTGTFIGNARKKAVALKTILPPDAWVLADDSGLCVDALDGAPGVESAYFAGPEGNAAANLAKLVGAMKAIPTEKRNAHFVCVLVLIAAQATELVYEGVCPGSLRVTPAGFGGFGYDPLFLPQGLSVTFSEMNDAEKNKVSHRGRAWLTLAESLKKRLVDPAGAN